MQKRFALLLTAFLMLAFPGCAAEEKALTPLYRQVTYTSELLTEGAVTSVDHYEYSYNAKGQLSTSVHYENGIKADTSTLEYDEYGNMIRKTTVSEAGTSISEIKYVLDDHQRIIREEAYGDGSLSMVTEYTYDAEGKETASTITSITGGREDDTLRLTKTYDRKGNLSETISKWSFSAAYHKSEYSDEKIIRQTEYSANDNVVEYLEYTYDDSGDLSKWIRYHSDGSVDNSCERVWDESGLILTELHYDSEGNQKSHKDVFTYDEHGNLLMQERYKDGEVYWRISHTYELIEETA